MKYIETQAKIETEKRQSEIETDKDRDAKIERQRQPVKQWDADGQLVTKSGSVTVLSLHFSSIKPAVGLHD